MTRWVARVPRERSELCSDLRRRPGIEVLEDADEIWLRGDALPRDLAICLEKIPELQRYEILGGDRLRLAGRRVPSRQLPRGTWLPVDRAFPVEVPPASLGAELPSRERLRLIRGGTPREPNVLRVDFVRLREFVETAAEFRWRPLRYAVSPSGQALVWGEPIPPIPGHSYVEERGIAVPTGTRWSPPVDGSGLASMLAHKAGELILFESDGHYARLSPESFVSVSRSSVRLTGEELHA